MPGKEIRLLSPKALIERIIANQGFSVEVPSIPKLDRNILADIAESHYLEHGLLSNLVQKNIDGLRSGAHIIRIAHQPNYLPYMNLIAHMSYLHLSAEYARSIGLEAVAVYLAVDHDICKNRRFHVAEAWDSLEKEHTKKFILRAALRHQKFPMYLVPPPSLEFVNNQIDQITNYSKSLRRQALRAGVVSAAEISPNIVEELAASVLGKGMKFRSLADFTIHGSMILMNQIWEVPVIFLPLSRLMPHMRIAYEYLEEQLAKVHPEGDFFWAVCKSCGIRTPQRNVGQYGYCTSCGQSQTRPSDEKLEQMRIPKVLIDDLADYVGIGVSGGSVYLSGREHIELAHESGRQAGIPIRPESIWALSTPPPTPAFEVSQIHYKKVGGVPPAAKRIVEMINSGKHSIVDLIAIPSFLHRVKDWVFDGITSGSNMHD